LLRLLKQRGVKLMRSRLTGELKLYVESEYLSPGLEPFEVWDEQYIKSEFQKECDNEGLDVIVSEVKHIRTPYADHLITKQYLPVEETAAKMIMAGQEVERLVDPATIKLLTQVIIKYVIPTICAAVIIWMIGTYFVGPLVNPPPAYKGFYQHDKEGNITGPMTYTEYITYKQAEHPDCYVCRYCGQVFCPEDYTGPEKARQARDEHEQTCPWRGKPWTQEVYAPLPFEQLVYVIIGGLIIVGLIFIIPRVLELVRRKKD